MVARNVVKNLAAAEDLLHGVGQTTQLRNGEVLPVTKVDIPLGLASTADLVGVDPLVNPRVRVGNTEFEYINGGWQERLQFAPYALVAGLTLDNRYNQVIKNGVVAAYTGTLPYLTTGLEDITVSPWQVLLASGGGVTPEPSEGNGIVYSDVLPAEIEDGVTYFNADKMEHVYSYNDGDSSQYLAIPLLAGSGGTTTGGGGVGGLSTLSTASSNGVTLVASTNTNEAHRVKSVIPGTGLKAPTTGTELTLNVDLANSTAESGQGLLITTDGSVSAKMQIKKIKAGTGVTLGVDDTSLTINASGGGSSGAGIEYTDMLPAVKVEGATYFNHSTAELVTTYNDGDSTQYLAYPMNGYGAVATGGGSGGATFNFVQLGSDGSTFYSFNGIDTYSFKRIKAGATATARVTDDGTTISVDALNIVAPAVSGASLVGIKTSTDQPIKRLVAGTNVTLNETATAITINSTASGGGATLNDSLTRINGLTPVNNNVMVWTGAGVDQFLTTSSTRAMMGLSTVGNTIPMFTGASTATLVSLTPYMVSLIATTGIPTALAHLGVTSGSNGNGNWLRIAANGSGGIQICWHTIVCDPATTAHGAGFFGAVATWTYPQAFGAVPAVHGSTRDGVQSWIMNGLAGNSTSSATFRQVALVSSVAAAVTVTAIGLY